MNCVACGQPLGANLRICQSCGAGQATLGGTKPARRRGPIRRFFVGLFSIFDFITDIFNIFH